MGSILADCGVAAALPAPAGVEVVQRQIGERTLTFLLNHRSDAQTVPLPEPMRDLLTGERHQQAIELPGRGVAILRSVAA
jgi:beta-galactosidase